MKKFILTSIVLCLIFQIQAAAKVIMPVTFGDGMVLQREMPLRIFGEASKGALVTVRFNGQERTAVSWDGKWMITLKPMPAGGPYELHILGEGDEIVFTDVMLGEVWLAGGQSNMEQALLSQIDFEKYLPAEENPELRFIRIPRTEFGEIDRDGLEWKYFDQESVRTFSAVTYFFATELQKRLGVTVGVIGSYRGATCNEYWMTPESIKGESQLKYLFEEYEKEYGKFEDEEAYEAAYEQFVLDLREWEKKGGWSYSVVPFPPMGPKSWQRPAGLYHTMIEPLQPYSIRGCIWYQGEGNSARHEEFRTLFPAFVEGWRKSWLNKELPFYFVQLPGYGKGLDWPQFRQAQLDCAKKIEYCGMVVSEGCNDEDDIHPRVKKPIGDRLAIAVSAEVYGQAHIPYGPIFRSVDFHDGNATISFDYSGKGLVLRSKEAGSFEIAGTDKVFSKALVAVNGGEMLLWNDEIQHPEYVRYAYSPNPDMVLFNREGLPASPFTTEITGIRPENLQCEYLKDPLGIDVERPRLSWKLESDQRGQKQTAYRLLVASSFENLNKEIGDLWDSGKVPSDQSLNVIYEGKPLKSRQQYFWKVMAWEKNGKASAWSASAMWSMGILHASEWKGQWIGGRNETAQSDMGLGFRSLSAKTAGGTKWVQIDLGKEELMKTLLIYTIKRFQERPNVTGNHGFPVRFYIEVADNPEMKNATRVVDFSQKDYEPPAHPKFRLPFDLKGVKGRYLRMTATRLRADAKGEYWFGMREMQVLSPAGRNVAASKTVTASESVETDEWGAQNLTAYFETEGSRALLLRKEVDIVRKPVRAIAYMCGLGMGELYINGKRIGDNQLDPADTDYRKRVMYVMHDVTGVFQKGNNALAVLLGNGWYDINFRDTWDFEGASWIGPKKLLLQIELEFADGTKQTIVSDPDWKCSTGEIVYNSLRGGESVDFRKTQTGWKQAGFDDSGWKPVVPLIAPTGRLESQKHVPVQVTKEVRPLRILEPSPGIYVFDMGQNFSGWVKYRASGKSGQKIQLNFAEEVNPIGMIDQFHWSSSYIYGRYQTGELILSGKKSDVYEPHFTYYGFQYVQVEGLDGKPSLDDMVGVMVHTDPEQLGDFACSNEKFNRLHAVITHSLLNYVHHRPRDPAREKLGWTQDSWQLSEPSYYNFELALNDRFWFRDMKVGQENTGHVPPVCPSPNWGNWGQPECMSCPWWGGAMTYGPWFLYKFKGDRALLEELYPHMKASVDFIHGTSKDCIINWGLGDWGSIPRNSTPINQANTCALYYLTTIVSQVAEILGMSEDAVEYNILANAIRDSFNQKYLDFETGSYGVNTQTAYALPLLLEMVPEEHIEKVQQHLRDEVKRANGHLNTGFVGTQALMKVLSDFDPEMAYSIANQEDEPSWWGMIKDGRTTIPEFWDGIGVQNIVSLGGPCENWFFYGLSGIRPDAAYPGFKHFMIKPLFVKDIDWVKAHHDSPFGRIAVEWKRKGRQLEIDVTVPVNTTAKVYLPGKNISVSGLPASEAEGIAWMGYEEGLSIFKVDSGTYSFMSKNQL